MFNVVVEKVDGILVTTSNRVAEELGKEHSKVLRTLDEILEKPNVGSLIFLY